jgi:hypothetical protein
VSGKTDAAVRRVVHERQRQDELVRQGKFTWNCSFDGPSYADKFAVLGEEVGEVGREVVEHLIAVGKYAADPVLKVMPPHREAYFKERLRNELVQVAAVCVAWVEALSVDGPHAVVPLVTGGHGGSGDGADHPMDPALDDHYETPR